MRFAILALPALAAAGAIPLPLGSTPPAGSVTINNVAYGGTGCPQGSVASIISDDKTTVTLIFDSYVASMGPGIAVTEQRKNCQLNVDILYPSGFQYSVLSADYRGYAALDMGMNATQKSTYYFSGQTAQTTTSTTFVGPFSADYLTHDQAASTSVVWSPCGAEGLLNINSQLALTRSTAYPKATGLMTDDSIDLKFTQVLYLNWQTCKK